MAGLAWVCQRLEQKQQRGFSVRRVLVALVVILSLSLSVSMIYVKSYYSEQYTGEELKGCVVLVAKVRLSLLCPMKRLAS